MRLMRALLWYTLFIWIMAGNALMSGETVVRAAFDLGSGSIRMQVAEVDPEKGEIVKVLFSDARTSLVAKDVVTGADAVISATMQHEILTQLLDMKAHAVPYGPICFAGIATEAYRLATNGKEVIEELTQKSGVHIQLVSQEEEALYGFMTGVASMKSNPDKTIVWDIGGGSFQLSFMDKGKLVVYGAPFGRTTTQKFIMENLRGQNYTMGISPNPLSDNDLDKFLLEVEKILPPRSSSLAEAIKKKGEVVVRIGNYPQALRDRESYTAKDLGEMIPTYNGLTDQEIPGPMPDVVVSDLFLEYGVMKALGIKQVIRARAVAGNTTGLLLSESIWKDLCPAIR